MRSITPQRDQPNAAKKETITARLLLTIQQNFMLTVVSPEGADDMESLLELMGFPPAGAYQKALFEAGIPAASFALDDISKEHQRMKQLGVHFKSAPTPRGP